MIRICLIFLSALLLSNEVCAIDATVAHALFYKQRPGGRPGFDAQLEIYWQVNPHRLHFVTDSQKMIVANIRTDIRITAGGKVVKEEHYTLETKPQKDVSGLATLSIIELRRYNIPDGVVNYEVVLTDINDTTSTFVYNDSVSVAHKKKMPFFSSVQMLDTLIPSDRETQFLKNGAQHIPLCADFLDDYKRTLHFYTEAYGIDSVPENRFPLVRKIRIGKKEDAAFVGGFEYVDTLRKPFKKATYGSFSIGPLKSGNYYLTATIEDKVGGVLASESRFIQRLNLHPEEPVVKKVSITEVFKDTAMESVTVLDLDKTFMAKFTFAQVRAILKMMLPVSDAMETNTIKNFLKKPNEMYMRYYIYNHFKALYEADPGKAWKEYAKKVMEVNKKFSAQGVPGYETDRGFVYLRYGPPSDIIVAPNEQGALPYEIWQYNTLMQFSNNKSLANALFLFYKSNQMMSDYRLLHSTVYGEVRNLSWRNYLYSNTGNQSTTGSNPNSRAEQYFGNR